MNPRARFAATVIAFAMLLPAFGIAVVMGISFAVVGYSATSLFRPGDVFSILALFGFGFGLIPAAGVGVAVALRDRKTGRTGWRYAVLAGLCGGIGFGVLLTVFAFDRSLVFLFIVLAGEIIAVIGSLLVWRLTPRYEIVAGVGMTGEVSLEPVNDDGWLEDFIATHWGSPGVISRGRVWSGAGLSAIRAIDDEGLAGVVSWRVDAQEWEVVTVNSRTSGQGVGTRMLDAVVEMARRAGAQRLWLVTSNDNLDALRFYQRRGWQLAALRPGAMAEARTLKPSMPELGAYGIPLRDEIELEYRL